MITKDCYKSKDEVHVTFQTHAGEVEFPSAATSTIGSRSR